MFHCAECALRGCTVHDMDKTPKDCPCKAEAIQREAVALYSDDKNHALAYNAACVEAEGYGQLCRLQEIMLYANKLGAKKLGLIFCIGLKDEAKTVSEILRYNGFDVESVCCKNGSVPKSAIGIAGEKTLSGCADEIMCNPIGQALLMNEAKTQLNILLGLCVGHDSLVMKHLEGPATVLAVKDRVTGHNPLAAVYVAKSYYSKKFFPKKAN